MQFEPIAIVGSSCTLPGALSPASLWKNVLAGQSAITHVRKERWDSERIGTEAWSDAGGYVEGFDAGFDPNGFSLPADDVRRLDPVFQWVLHGAREALRGIGHEGRSPRAGLILGNLSFPTRALAGYSESVWLDRQGSGFLRGKAREIAGIERPLAYDRFMSGLPANLAARGLGLEACAFALDAACASSLYAIKLACDRLHDRKADVLVAGAVNASDTLFIHVGFCALSAMSRTGQSRPFHRDADGLVPAEGAGFVVLKRLRDAVAAGDRILGIIRGIGLSNDGRGRGLLVPSEEGQIRAMRLAYAMAELSPRDMSVVECHATGTPVGDATEVRSMSRVFEGVRDLPIGSIKSNLGHLITVAGMAGVIKVLSAMEAGTLPPTRRVEAPIDALADSPFRLLTSPEPWGTGSPRRAAVSAFGFGGNNAHLLLEQWTGVETWSRTQVAVPETVASTSPPVAVVGLFAAMGEDRDLADFTSQLFSAEPSAGARQSVTVALEGFRFPPNDIAHTLPQQLFILEAAREAARGIALPRERTAVLVGMGTDPEVARYGVRWKIASWAERWASSLGTKADPAWVSAAQDAAQSHLVSAGVLGTMPNIPANRINSQLDLAGPSMTVSAEESSGVAGLEVAVRALQKRELDAALVGAVDLSDETVHRTALAELGVHRMPADAAVVLILKRLDDALADGDRVLAVLDESAEPSLQVSEPLAPRGSAHAAAGLLDVAAAVLMVHHGLRFEADRTTTSWAGARVARVRTASLLGPSIDITVRAHGPAEPLPPADAPHTQPGREMTVTVAAHRRDLLLCPMEGDVQLMDPAPHLAPILDESDAEPLPRAARPATAPAPRRTVAPRLATALAHAGEQQARVAAVHEEYLTGQAATYQRFLALQQTIVRDLLARAPRPSAPSFRPVAPQPSLPVPVPIPAPVPHKVTTFSRAELEVHASGRISSIFGPAFEGQDRFARQVRMPEPPLLLVDRVTGIEAEPNSMRTGTIRTETTVRADGWYLHDGRMPAGIMIESGQADLMLISWLGIDRFNRGERVYRLLGCELSYQGELPRPGDVLDYDIHIDGHAQDGDTRLFFFHYDCRVNGKPALRVRGGQAGFFSDEELANSAGVLWDPAADKPTTGAKLDPPVVNPTKSSFDAEDLRAFSEGRIDECFGPGFELARTHVRSPRIAAGRMLLLEKVTDLAVRGGPWGRGYLRAELPITEDQWFFDGHFKNDPCMPGTLMFEGCLQAMSFYLAALGFTLDRDGWRFEPAQGTTSWMRCRGQVTPASKMLVYEVFVHEVSGGTHPELKADLLCTVDGVKAFHAARFAIRLVPDWPLEAWKLGAYHEPTTAGLPLAKLGGLQGYVEPKPVATHEGFAFDYGSLLACAWGRPTTAFGPFYERFDSARRVARLPGPPYHFVSRVLRVDAEMGVMKNGASVEVEYDIPPSAWYFDLAGTMPFCVLMEAALQPCGWLASFIGSTLSTDIDLMFRNLDGTATLTREIRPDSGTLRTRARIVNISKSAGMIIESFLVECFLGDERIYEMNTVFGFFPKEAFENQSGLPVTDDERTRIAQPAPLSIDLRTRPARYFDGAPRVPGGMLCMLDRITAFEPQGGRKGLGWVRGEKDVDPAEWFFKAHFFQDPVQPGSLGIEAFCQLLQVFMIERGMAAGIPGPRFEPVAIDRKVSWKYRGQVVPKNRLITTEIEITEIGTDARGRYVLADAALWVDGKCIYNAKGFGMRIIASSEPPDDEEVLDPSRDTWLDDHRPTWTLPALPLMSMVDRMAARAQGREAFSDVRVHRWLVFPGGPVRLRTDVREEGERLAITLSAWRESKNAALSRFEPVATGYADRTPQGETLPEPWPPLDEGAIISSPYEAGSLFHGPAFQMLRSLRLGAKGASAVLDAGADAVPPGTLRQGLLDGVTHAIPHEAFSRWSSDIPDDQVAYPHAIPHLRFYGALPSKGDVRIEVRFAGFDGDPRRPMVDAQIIADGRVLAELRLVEILLPKGPIGMAPPEARRAFLRDRIYVPGVGLAQHEAEATRLELGSVQQSDWLPGNVARIYDTRANLPLLEQVAIKEHVARRAEVHPADIRVADDLASAVSASRPLRNYPFRLERGADHALVSATGESTLDISSVTQFWREHFACGAWPVEDLFYGLVDHFVGDVVLTDPRALEAIRGRSVLYLANHQVGIESLMFSVLIPALTGSISITLAKAEHRTSWLGGLIRHCFTYPGVHDPQMMTFFNREDQSELISVVQNLAAEMRTNGKSAMIHVEGTRSLSCRQPVVRMSSTVLDMALGVGCPIVPLRFSGGLPVEDLEEREEFPVGYGRQTIWVGRPIEAEQVARLPLKERKQCIIEAINGLGPACSDEQPSAPNPELKSAVQSWIRATGVVASDAVLFSVLNAARTTRSALTERLLEGARTGKLVLGGSTEEQWLGALALRLFGPRGPSVESS
ncbi:polyketide synthase dehydratase domain-containing protein [Pendulispora rubella]|uniref:Polyketide synthase dehydratase domain-containing protein n=1 Tax=Pendulispora rubella TaxID=2741070 RepID=A0ABZ2L4C8_9BACT